MLICVEHEKSFITSGPGLSLWNIKRYFGPLQQSRLGGRMVRSLLQLSKIWSCHIWPVDRLTFAYLRQIQVE